VIGDRRRKAKKVKYTYQEMRQCEVNKKKRM
jgi:hypothetical protein